MTETPSKTITANIGGRSPLKHHGILGDKGETGVIYASMPMALARAKLKPAAKTVAVLIWSHSEGWELSIASLAEDSGMTRKTVGKAVEELQAARWLVRQPYGQPGKKPAGEVWHIQLTNLPFTGAQVEELSQLVPIATGGNTLSTPGESFLPTAGESFLPTAGESLLLTKVVDLPEVDLQAVQAPASLDAEPVVVADKTAGDKKEPSSSLPVVEKVVITEDDAWRYQYPYSRRNPGRTPEERQAEYEEKVKSLPDYFTPEVKAEATSKGFHLLELHAQVTAPGINSPEGYLKWKLSQAPKVIAGGKWQE